MRHVALLRGINVGGNRTVDMKRLKATFEAAGMSDVRTYINSGNVIFQTKKRDRGTLVHTLQTAIAKRFGFEVPLLLRDLGKMRSIVKAMPAHWTNDEVMKCDVMFLWDEVARPSVVKRLTIKPNIDDVRYADGAVIWRVDRKNVTRSGMQKLVGSRLYRLMTIRNCNTTRRLVELLEE